MKIKNDTGLYYIFHFNPHIYVYVHSNVCYKIFYQGTHQLKSFEPPAS